MVHPSSFHHIVDQASVVGAPEGPWSFVSERRPAALTFNPDLVTKLVVAKIPNGSVPGVSESTFILWNAHTALFIYPASMSERVSLRVYKRFCKVIILVHDFFCVCFRV